MVHASLSAFGNVDGGAETVVAALATTSGQEGAVIVPSFRDAIRSDNYALSDCQNCRGKKLCPSRERGFTGIIGETVRQNPQSLRSCHPTHSWVGIGKDAAFLLEGHCHSLTPCGTDSPFFRLLQRDGVILLLGVGVNALTNIHAVEDARNVPYLSAIDPAHRHATYTTSARRIQYAYPELLDAAMREVGIIRSQQIASAMCHVISARMLGAFLWVITESDPWCPTFRPRGQKYDPDKDAREKTVGMVKAWKANPDENAWQALAKRSQEHREPVLFEPTEHPQVSCPAYRGVLRDYHRCAANGLPPWEKFEDYPREPGVATCGHCNWPKR